MNNPVLDSLNSLEDARRWIGRRIVLKRQLGGFDAGTCCIVMCSVDFGDGLLLWVKTTDDMLQDVGQLTLTAIRTYFRLLEPDSEAGKINAHGRSVSVNPRSGISIAPTSAPPPASGFKSRAVTAAKKLLGFGIELARIFASAQHAAYITERYLCLGDRELAARGLKRSQIKDRILDSLCGAR